MQNCDTDRQPHRFCVLTSAELGFLLLHPHHRNLREALVERRCFQFCGHFTHDIFGHDAIPTIVALNANLERHVKEYCVGFISEIFRQFDPIVALMRSEIGSVNVIRWTTGDEPRLQHGSKVRKYQVLKTLFGRIVEQY